MNNIYEDFGRVISDLERYIPRESSEESIKERIFGKNYGSYSLVGLPRMGKSTLLHHLFKDSEEYIVINIVLSCIPEENIKMFFDKLARSIVKRLKRMSLYNEEIQEALTEYNSCDFETLGTEYFLEFIEVIAYETGQKLYIVIDEFDAASKLFKNGAHYFQIIREMAIQSRYNTVFIFLSRRLVEEIEMRMDGISNLKQVLKIGYMKPYSQIEQDVYFKKLERYFEVTELIRDFYEEKTGFYPYLMDILSVYLVYEYNQRELTKKFMDQVYTQYINEFYEQYEKLQLLLIEEDLFDAILHVAFDLPFSVKPEKIQRLRNYGLINISGTVFSDSFQQYLLSRKGLSDYHQVWNKTEKLLKQLSKEVYGKNYGKDWEQSLQKKYANHKLKKQISNAKYYMQIEMQQFNSNENVNYIDTIATSGLLWLIEEEWLFFADIFGKSKEYWVELFEPIKNIRNVIQHNREEVLHENDSIKVIFYCEEIIETIEKHARKVN